MTLPAGYSLRPARVGDANGLAHLRAGMFTDLGAALEHGWEGFWTQYFAAALTDGRYWAVIAEYRGEPVACAGLMLLPLVPVPSDPSGLRAQVQGVYTLPERRGCGLGALLTTAVLKEAVRLGLKSANPNASVMGRTIYERLGFTEASSPEMRLPLEQLTLAAT